MSVSNQVMLRWPTPTGWAEQVCSDWPRFLQDHAACERKAAAFAMGLVAHYPDAPWLVTPMVALAREELQHFSDVVAVMRKLEVPLAADEKDAYVGALMRLGHGPGRQGLLQRLAVAAVIEARGAERFALLSEALEQAPLRAFYRQLATSETGHALQFKKLAQRHWPDDAVDLVFDKVLEHEANVAASLPWQPRLH